MSYLPRPDAARTQQDVDEIYLLTVEELRTAQGPEERREVFHKALLRAYQAGTDAQRDITRSYEHERPTPVPPPPAEEDIDPGGDLPDGPRLQTAPRGAFMPGKPWRRQT
jgi:hypothetical protein